LHYYDVDYSEDEVVAPLFLLPVSIERVKRSFKDKHSFVIAPLEEDIQLNPALIQKLLTDFNLELPSFTNEIGVKNWLVKARKTIGGKRDWKIAESICIGIFTFEKLQMYLDIEKYRDKILANPLLQIIAGAPAELAGSFEGVPKEEELDDKVMPPEMNHVLIADSSQQVAIEAAKKGVSFVIQGPPGTGKSQTIVNIIAELLESGKRVLFVSEKMAALEVVKKRLDDIGLGEYCLELHSHRANKKQVLRQLEKQLYHHRKLKTTYTENELYPQLERAREEINQFGDELLKPRGEIKNSIYEARGNLAQLSDVPRPSYEIGNVMKITREEFDRSLVELKNLEGYQYEILNFVNHPWKKTTINQFGLSVREKLGVLLPKLGANAQNLSKLINETQKKINIKPKSIQSIEKTLNLLEKIEEDQKKIALRKEWFKKDIERMLEIVKAITRDKEAVENKTAFLTEYYNEKYFDINAVKLLREFKEKYTSPFQYLKLDFWRERRKISKEVSKYLKSTRRSFNEMRADLGELILINKLKKKEASAKVKIKSLLPEDLGEKSKDWRALQNTLVWVQELKSLADAMPLALIKEIVADTGVTSNLFEKYKQVYQEEFKANLDVLLGFFEEDFTRWDQPLEQVDIQDVFEWFNDLKGGITELRRWIEFNNYVENLEDSLNKYVLAFLAERHKSEFLVDSYRKIFWQEFLNGTENQITRLSSDRCTERVHQFQELDTELHNVARKKIVTQLEKQKPHIGTFINTHSSEMAILKREIRKERRHMPLRNLLSKIPNLISVLKPCFMMSPLSVAQYINLDNMEPFDAVLFDEASQIMPEDAVSTLIRAGQAIIVGDSQQLPPNRFFMSLDEDLEIEEELEDLNSILDETSARLVEKYLKWHYRSRDEALITFSNRKFYDSRLVTFPNSLHQSDKTGIEYIYIKDGVYDRGGSRKNLKEAQKVVELVEDHIKNRPNKSLGVVAFSIQQQRAIQEQIEIFIRLHPKYAKFFTEDVLHEFFVKNLETVQGDERDVIIFSVGYGPDQAGKMTLNFGPINRSGGYKRLNVAITRAREKIYLVSSFQPEDINLEDVSNQGLRYLLGYMRYAKEGVSAVLRMPEVSDVVDLESNFEEAVYNELVQRGWDLATQVGSSGYRIDLAVKHPKQKGRFILGIECDGSAYHSSKTARDRDRIRQLVLENLGWNIHRIWSTDWLLDKGREVKKIERKLRNILSAKNNTSNYQNGVLSKASADRSVEVIEEIKDVSDKLHFQKYEPVKLPRQRRGIESFNYSYYKIKEQIIKAVKAESPIHIELLLKRIADAWGLGRIGANVRRTILYKLEYIENEKVKTDGNIIWYGEKQKLSPVRISTEEQRPFEYVTLEELGWLAVELLKNGYSVDEEDLMFELSRQFGYTRRGTKIQRHLKKVIEYLLSINRIKRENKRIKLVNS